MTDSASTTVSSCEDCELNRWSVLLWGVFIVITLLIIIVGNTSVTWITLRFLRMQSFTNLLLANMCFAQLLLAVFFSPFRFVYSLNRDLYFGKSYCRFSNFVANMSVAVTAITLSIISVERFLAIVWSINTRIPKKITLLMIISFWVAGFAIGVPSAVYFSTIIHKDNGTTRTGYVLTWVDGDPSNSSLDHTYNVAMLHMAYVVPICIMAVCCSGTAIKLWFRRSSGQPTQREIDIMHYKRKEFIMLVSMMMVFATCTLPYHLLNIYTDYDPAKQNSALAKHLNLAINWLVGFPAVVNPLLNLWMNSRFRKCLMDAWRNWHCPLWKRSVHLEGAESPVFRTWNFPSGSTSGAAEVLTRPPTPYRRRELRVAGIELLHASLSYSDPCIPRERVTQY